MKRNKNDSTNTMEDVAKTFMIISCGVAVFIFMYNLLFFGLTINEHQSSAIPFLIGMIACVAYLGWTIPMTVIYFRKIHSGEQPSLAFKICTTIFVNSISGILMLVDNKEVAEN